MSNARLNLVKNYAKAKQHPFGKNVQINKCGCFYEIILLTAMKVKMLMKDR